MKQAWAQSKSEEAERLELELREAGARPDAFCHAAEISYYLRKRKFEEARELLEGPHSHSLQVKALETRYHLAREDVTAAQHALERFERARRKPGRDRERERKIDR